MADTCCSGAGAPATPPARADAVRRALRLEYFTVGWNVVEGCVAITAALVAGSVVLLGFGIDSFVESASGLVMIWRLRAERREGVSDGHLDAVEHRARRLVAVSLFLLAGYVLWDASSTLLRREEPEFSAVGVGLTAVSMSIMLWLARAKRRVARELGSRAMEADAFQTTACWWLSVATLVGVGLNGLAGWWWADPVAAFVVAALVVKEAVAAWRGESDCC
jgi:divalent metal cation (Fe/Co/Zn/Cd) transporter